jgi:hypothetical protein
MSNPTTHEQRVARINAMFPGRALEAEVNADMRRRANGDEHREPVTGKYEVMLRLFASWARLSDVEVAYLRSEGRGAVAAQIIVFRAFGSRYEGVSVPSSFEREHMRSRNRVLARENSKRAGRKRAVRRALRQRAPRRRMPARTVRTASRDGHEPPGGDDPPGGRVRPSDGGCQ